MRPRRCLSVVLEGQRRILAKNIEKRGSGELARVGAVFEKPGSRPGAERWVDQRGLAGLTPSDRLGGEGGTVPTARSPTAVQACPWSGLPMWPSSERPVGAITRGRVFDAQLPAFQASRAGLPKTVRPHRGYVSRHMNLPTGSIQSL